MNRSIFILVLFSVFLGACRKETALNGMLEEKPAVAERGTGAECAVKFRVTGISTKRSSGIITVRHYEADVLVGEQTFQFKPPFCTTCPIELGVTPSTRLELTGEVFTGIDLNPAGKLEMAVSRPGSGLEKVLALPGDGTTKMVWEGFSCED